MAHNRRLLVPARFARVGAVLCLVALFLGPSQVVPGLLALGAALEGSHAVRVGMDQSQFHLVLSHERGQADRPDYNPRHHAGHPAHHHGLAAGILCFLGDSRGLEPDHVANFTMGTAGERRAQTSLTESQGELASLALPSDCAGFTVTAPAIARLRQHHGPPERTGLQQLLRSTVLLV
jgi:hypothetical protein